MRGELDSRLGRDRARGALAAIAALGASAAALKFLPVPYFWIFIAWLVVFGAAARSTGNRSRQALGFNAAFVCLALAATELYLSAGEPVSYHSRLEVRYPDGYIVEDDVLGYVPAPNAVAHTTAHWDGTPLYDVVYTIDADGLRIAPSHEPRDGDGCLLFFGGSFIFGEGVNDHETLPFRVGVETGGLHRVYNFGFHGYGPHQMLAALEQGLVEATIECRPTHVFYLGIGDHVARVAATAGWVRRGPRYVLEGGELVHRGQFEDARRDVTLLRRQLEKWTLFEELVGWWRGRRDRALLLAIVNASQDRIDALYPESEFHVLWWPSQRAPTIVEALRARGITVHRIEDILPDLGAPKYKLRDSHPSPLTHQLMAGFVAREILAADARPELSIR